ncbi:hypothetical protein BN946_scf184912.g61 [Trametes cinnabarina]|uniref:Reverse transcriptase zinc-binding domain-containing protein n=1 Tax=Pycnoporus cinnabarinus TaxID=5643 RepID=A0A060SSP4_PYCCI|nr:hypothetical protein BN946_scf184912.g61 [Trametes cinnabarina]
MDPNTSAAHRCLLVDEIFSQIARSDYYDEESTALVQLSLTCKALHAAVLPLLWRDMDDIVPLLKLLPQSSWSEHRQLDGDAVFRYLHRFGRAPDATCPTCLQEPETVAHYLFACPTYSLHRAIHFRTLGFSGRTLRTLLNSRDALRPLFAYINATGRLRTVFGALPDPCPDDDDTV